MIVLPVVGRVILILQKSFEYVSKIGCKATSFFKHPRIIANFIRASGVGASGTCPYDSEAVAGNRVSGSRASVTERFLRSKKIYQQIDLAKTSTKLSFAWIWNFQFSIFLPHGVPHTYCEAQT
ncbi:MAG: hypothetical protein IPJ54_20250 [Saprospiraceae bacterium]|nr:hypothetical protein [Saprospiraceae bacterium]